MIRMPSYLMLVLACILFFHARAMTQVLTDFETGLDGWTAVGDGQFYLEEGAGNPGNVMRVDDDATGNMLYAIAPRQFLGDWRIATEDDSLFYDVFLTRINGNPVNTSRIFTISGPGGRAYGLLGSSFNAPDQQWRRYVISLNPDDWVLQSGTWEALIQNVTLLELTAEFIVGAEYVRLDNIGLTFTPEIQKLQANLHNTFDQGGFEGWIFENAGPVSVQNTGGNPDGYLRIGDASGVISNAIAPPAYLGDWTDIDGQAALNFDINIISHSGTLLDPDFFVRISGPGGAARVDLPDDIVEAYANWKTFSFFISEQDWIVEEGTWAGLMQQVDELRITVEFLGSGEVIGFDNPMITDAPPVTDFTVTKPFIFLGDSTNFRDNSRMAPFEWNWNFGDGNSSSDRDPWHEYTVDGLYTVGLSTTNRFGTTPLQKENFVEVAGITDSLLFADDFASAPIHPAWTLLGNCSWSISGSTLAQTSNYNVPNDLRGACFGLTGSRFWDDYLLNLDFRSTDNDGIGAFFRYEDADNFYLFYWREEIGHRALKKFVDGVETDVIADTAYYESNRWYNLKIKATGPEITVWLDDEILYEVTDSTFSEGKAGVYCWANQSSYWDNFKVTRTNMSTGTSLPVTNELPGETRLDQNYPNPFNPSTNIRFAVQQPEQVTVTVYDITGRLVSTLFSGTKSAGWHEVAWDASGYGSGIYVYRLQTGSTVLTRKMMLIK